MGAGAGPGADGSAWVQLPDYFEALNTDPSYRLTPIGGAMPAGRLTPEGGFRTGTTDPKISGAFARVTGPQPAIPPPPVIPTAPAVPIAPNVQAPPSLGAPSPPPVPIPPPIAPLPPVVPSGS